MFPNHICSYYKHYEGTIVLLHPHFLQIKLFMTCLSIVSHSPPPEATSFGNNWFNPLANLNLLSFFPIASFNLVTKVETYT